MRKTRSKRAVDERLLSVVGLAAWKEGGAPKIVA